jgi:hypothetical protein
MHTIPDITREEDLIRYAVAAQLARLSEVDQQLSQRIVGRVVAGGDTAISHALAGTQIFSSGMLRELDRACVSLAPQLDHNAGLAQFGVRMRGLTNRESLLAYVPSNYFTGTTSRSDDELHVMTQTSDILERILTAEKAKRSTSSLLHEKTKDVEHLVRRLILIASAPPTPRNVEAQILLGSLAKYFFQETFSQMEYALRSTTLGFRVWRTLTKMVLLSQSDAKSDAKKDDRLAKNLQPRISSLLSEAATLRASSAYPGRSLDLELAISLPANWLEPVSVTDMLLVRARDPAATLRERATAAHGIWQRALATGRADEEFKETMTELIEHFRKEKEQRPDVGGGLEWVATTLEYLTERDEAVCNDWPQTDAAWFGAVKDAADLLGRENIAERVRDGTRKLFEHILLQNAGVERRRAIEAVGAGGYVEPVVRALMRVLMDPRSEVWLRIRAIFALGFLQHPSPMTQNALTEACRKAIDAVQNEGTPTMSAVNELHTALFAIGDCYGAVGVPADHVRTIRNILRPQLEELVNGELIKKERMYLVARAMVYMLNFTAQRRENRETPDFAQELLRNLSQHPDRVTRDFANWALGYRFRPSGEVSPILRAAN